jgi:hypothetical protein
MAAPDVLQKSSFSPQIALETSKLGKMPIETTHFVSFAFLKPGVQEHRDFRDYWYD